MNTNAIRLALIQITCAALLVCLCRTAHAQNPAALDTKRAGDDPQSSVLSRDEWRRVDSAVERALDWLASRQQPDGSFPTIDTGQPGVTSLCTLAFMAHGHNPGQGKYGERLERAVTFIASCQKQNGLIALTGPDGPRIDRTVSWELGVTMAYNHAISSLALSEVYGMGKAKRADAIKRVIDKSLATTLTMQHWPKDHDVDRGGWRYILDFDDKDSDLSLTGWNLMFLRSARNAGFEVPKQSIDDAVAYIRRTFEKDSGVFIYTTMAGDSQSRAMAGAGILALAHAGYHNSEEARQSGEWLLRHPFTQYNGNNGIRMDRYHYSLFNACYGMYQLGGQAWAEFFPLTVRTLLASQAPDGSWDAESFQRDRAFGKAYTTALVVLSLGAPNQFLPVFQR